MIFPEVAVKRIQRAPSQNVVKSIGNPLLKIRKMFSLFTHTYKKFFVLVPKI